jgi:peptidoglycan/xylan/chitin deacetylase (PgdA/CDA1 family)
MISKAVLRRASLVSLVCAAFALWLTRAGGAIAEESQRPSNARLRIAITVDDLPSSVLLAPGYTSERLIDEMVRTLEAHGVRHATGFVIGERVDGDPTGRAALARWARAGFEFGNHSYSHRHLEQLGADDYFADVARMEPAMRVLERETHQSARYFRYPFLEEGRSTVERKQLTTALGQLGYTLARVSLDFNDWAWADPYARCLARNDTRALAVLSASYLEYASASLDWSVQAARQVLRRPIPHVLLLHANVVTAQNLDALLSEYERQGAQFVPLAEALSDSAYEADYEARGGNMLALASQSNGRPLPPAQVRPIGLLELVCP